MNPSITLHPDRGNPGSLSVDGSGFGRSTAGRVFFDTNGNGLYDSGEPSQSLTTSGSGTFSTTLVIPMTGRTSTVCWLTFRSGCPLEASATFNLVLAEIVLSPEQGNPGDTVRIDGDSFAANTPGRVFFDTNGNGVYDLGGAEPVSLTTDADGYFSTTLTAPSGHLTVDAIADFPIGSPVEASATFRFSN